MLGFRFNPPGPFWFEDLMFFVVDEARRLPVRARSAAARVRMLGDRIAHFDPTLLMPAKIAPAPTPASAPRRETAPLEARETWELATEPLVAVGTGTATAIALHRAAAEQLDALTYVLDRMREELRPMMTYARFKGDDDNVQALRATQELETSIEALLELSRQNAATRPKDRVRPAA